MTTRHSPLIPLDSDYVVGQEQLTADPALIVNPAASRLSLLDAIAIRVQRVRFTLETLSTSERSDLRRGAMYFSLAAILDESEQLLKALSAKGDKA